MSSVLEDVLVEIAFRHVLPLLVERATTSAVHGAMGTQLPPALADSLGRGSVSLVSPLPDSEKVTVASSTPGRLRFHVAGLRGNPTRAEAITAALRRLPGTRTVSANPLTGNVLVHYEPEQIGAAEILEAAESVGPVSGEHSSSRPGRDRPLALSVVH